MTAYRRKEYQELLNGSLALTSLSDETGGEVSAKQSRNMLVQRPHQDYQTTGAGLEYFFLGNGFIQAAVQHSSVLASGTPLGLLLMHPEHFARKSSTFLYHPESGLERSMITVIANERIHHATPESLEVHWEYPADIPTVVAAWRAGRCLVREELWCPIGFPFLVRRVRVSNKSTLPISVQIQAMLYPNQMLFDEQSWNEDEQVLEARGYLTLRLSLVERGRAYDRWLTTPLREVRNGEECVATFVYSLDGPRRKISARMLWDLRKKTTDYWKATSTFRGHETLDHLFRVSKTGLRAAIASSGKMDSGIWQYNLEWIRDESMIVVGLVMSGQEKLAKTFLQRMMDTMVSEQGVTLESSRWRGFDLYEPDQNGELLYAHWMYWRWTNDDSLIKKYWKKLVAVAELPLREELWDHESGLIRNTREFWERSAPHGVREGYELAYQLWPSIGLQKAAEMALMMKKANLAGRWTSASEKLRHAMLTSPKHALIEGGRFIKRRLVSGEVQSVFVPPDRRAMSPGVPLAVEDVCYCDPDTQEALPIALEFVSPTSGLARNTMAELEKLWNQRWDSGGYARYNVSSEPDSPGPWPFPTLFVARAYLEMGDYEKVWRALEWLHNVQGGNAGSWLEVYCDRPVPPLPPVGVTPWTWAEVQVFIVHHLLGIRPGERQLVIRPRLLTRMREVRADVRVHGKRISLHIRRGRKKRARVGEKKFKLIKRMLTIPYPKRDVKIEMTV
jgi:hypothetical protein